RDHQGGARGEDTEHAAQPGHPQIVGTMVGDTAFLDRGPDLSLRPVVNRQPINHVTTLVRQASVKRVDLLGGARWTLLGTEPKDVQHVTRDLAVKFGDYPSAWGTLEL